MFSALRHRNYRLFFIGQGVSVIGSWMQGTALSWLVLELANSPFMLGVSGAASSAPMLAFGLFGGALADRASKRRIIITTQSCAMILAFLLALLVASGRARLWHIILANAIAGTIMAFDIPARQAFAVEMVGKADLMNAIALNSSLFNGARIIGPSVAGLVIAWKGPAVCFFANSASFMAVIAALAMMRFPAQLTRTSASLLSDVREGLGTIWQDRGIRAVVAAVGVFAVFGGSYGVLMPVFARDILHSGATGYGLLLSAAGAGALVGALSLTGIGARTTARRLASGAMLSFSAGVLVFAFSRSFWLSFACLVIVGWSLMSYLGTTNTFLQLAAADEVRGRVISAYVWFSIGLAPLGSLQIGAVAQRFGAPVAVAVGGVMAALLALMLMRVVPEVRLTGSSATNPSDRRLT
jgi:MFS family permease